MTDDSNRVPIEDLLEWVRKQKEDKDRPTETDKAGPQAPAHGIWKCSKCGGSGSLYEKTCPICEIPTQRSRYDQPRSAAPLMCGICGGESTAMMNLGKGAVVCMQCQRKGF